MEKNKGTVCYTIEDKKNHVLLEYPQKEFEINSRNFKKKLLKKRMILIIIVLTTMLLTRIFSNVLVTVILKCFVLAIIFYFFLNEFVCKRQYDIECSKYYIEIMVDNVLPIIVESDLSASEGPNMRHFFPIEGHDIRTNYHAIYYISEKQYKEAKTNEIMKINIKKDAWL